MNNWILIKVIKLFLTVIIDYCKKMNSIGSRVDWRESTTGFTSDLCIFDELMNFESNWIKWVGFREKKINKQAIWLTGDSSF